MDFEQYRDRRTAPLKWHKFVTAFALVMGIIFALLSILIAVNFEMLVQGIEQGLIDTEMSIPLPADAILKAMIIGGFVSLAITGIEFWLGRSFNIIYIILVGIGFAASAVSTVSTTLNNFSASSLVSTIISLGIVALQAIYYYKRLPLFARNYKDPSDDDEVEVQINYDQINR